MTSIQMVSVVVNKLKSGMLTGVNNFLVIKHSPLVPVDLEAVWAGSFIELCGLILGLFLLLFCHCKVFTNLLLLKTKESQNNLLVMVYATLYLCRLTKNLDLTLFIAFFLTLQRF